MRGISCLAAKFTVSFSRRTLLHVGSKLMRRVKCEEEVSVCWCVLW
jgi:hypothetical protein